jgi:site-specific recombinase XerD
MNTAIISTQPAALVPQQAHSDSQLIALWLHGKSEHSQRAYIADVQRLLAAVPKSLAEITLSDLQGFADSLRELSANTQKRVLSAVKSLFTFAHKLGYIRFNVGAALKAPAAKHTLAERILAESEVHAMIALTSRKRDQLLLRVIYASAGRVSEVCALTWADVQPNGDSGQLTLFGKGGKTRAVKLSKATWQALQAYRQGRVPQGRANEPVFVSQKGGPLDASQVHRIVREAARRAGIAGNVSPHWLRHSHASHALERGASVALVRDTLGHASLAVTSMYTHAKPSESSALHLSI